MEEEVSSLEDAARESRGMTSVNYVASICRSCRNRESHDEVAELAAELRRAYMVKELHAQLEEKQSRRHAESIERKRECAELARQQQREALEEHLRCHSENLRKTEDYKRQLNEQLMRKKEERRVLMEEAREYRKILEERDRVQEEWECATTLKKKRELAEWMRRERLIFEEAREIRQQEEREMEEKKRYEDLEYLQAIEERSKEVSRLQREQIERRENVLLEVMKMILDAETQKREREERLIDLVAEEIRCELIIKEKEQAMRGKRIQRELAANLKEQIVLTEQNKQRFVEEDRAWAENIMKKIMEDEKIAKYTAEAKKRMRVQYRQDLENLIAHRRRIREEEIARIEESVKEEQRLEYLEAQCAKEERRRLLAEHAASVANFVNRTTLTAEEQRILDESTKENRNTENIDNDMTVRS